jgi:hypothetical protein
MPELIRELLTRETERRIGGPVPALRQSLKGGQRRLRAWCGGGSRCKSLSAGCGHSRSRRNSSMRARMVAKSSAARGRVTFPLHRLVSSFLGRDREFADSPLEESGFELMVPLQCQSHPEPLRNLSLRMGSLRHLSFRTDFTSDPVRVRMACSRGHCSAGPASGVRRAPHHGILWSWTRRRWSNAI